MGTLTHDRKRDREAPWRWLDEDGDLDMSDSIILAVHRWPDAPARLVGRDLYQGRLINAAMRLTDRGLALQAAYRAWQER